jgi:hypothetical protein
MATKRRLTKAEKAIERIMATVEAEGFTNEDVVDLIIGLTVNLPEGPILDDLASWLDDYITETMPERLRDECRDQAH